MEMAEAVRELDWRCEELTTNKRRELVWLRFTGWNREVPPKYLVLQNSLFERITISALGLGGSVASRSYKIEDARPLRGSASFALALPETDSQPSAFIVRIERPLVARIAYGAQVMNNLNDALSPAVLVMVAVAVGILLVLFTLDLATYYILRERFIAAHAGLSASLLAFVSLQGGILAALVDLPITFVVNGAPLSWAVATGFLGLFIAECMEKQILPRLLDRLLRATAIGVIVMGITGALLMAPDRPFALILYMGAILPPGLVYLLSLVVGLKRGSRTARFLAAGWVPTLVLSVDVGLRAAGLYDGTVFPRYSIFFTLAIASLVFSLGVATRFLSIRRERDQALVKARTLKELSERDPLTGLLNRRVVEDRFQMLREEGFSTLAVLDLDHFKLVNDTLGHAGGDRVLQVAGRALTADDENIMAFRMGGEEFLLLVRGADPVRRAEERRQQIARAVAMEDLGCLVTASMGLVELSGGALPGAGFSTLYARADRLLYQAKASGRNRMVCERIRVFQPRTRERRAA